jgi:hypothetical protein
MVIIKIPKNKQKMDGQRNEIRRLHHVCAEYREEKKEGIRMLLEQFAGKLSLQEIITIAEKKKSFAT